MFGNSLDDIRKLIATVIGFTILLIGIALLVLPGPGLLVIILGLIVLAGEFVWAKNTLNNVKKTVRKAIKKEKQIVNNISRN